MLWSELDSFFFGGSVHGPVSVDSFQKLLLKSVKRSLKSWHTRFFLKIIRFQFELRLENSISAVLWSELDSFFWEALSNLYVFSSRISDLNIAMVIQKTDMDPRPKITRQIVLLCTVENVVLVIYSDSCKVACFSSLLQSLPWNSQHYMRLSQWTHFLSWLGIS